MREDWLKNLLIHNIAAQPCQCGRGPWFIDYKKMISFKLLTHYS